MSRKKVAVKMMKLIVTNSNGTVLKPGTEQSNSYPPGECATLAKGEYPILACADQGVNHVKVTFDPTRNKLKEWHPSGKNTWFLFYGHIELEGTEKGNHPQDEQPEENNKGRAVLIPGLGTRYLGNPIDGCANFTWTEATHGGGRIPENESITKNVLKVAAALEEVRTVLGDQAMSINSWYRPPAINRSVGGATHSRHIQGDAVDFRHATLDPYTIYRRLDSWWGTRGGLASSSIFTHIDCRNYRARWDYGF